MPKRKLPCANDLKVLPRRATVAFAVRCARRVQPLYTRAKGIANHAKHRAAIEKVLTLAERFCRDTPSGLFGFAAEAEAADANDRVRAAWSAAIDIAHAKGFVSALSASAARHVGLAALVDAVDPATAGAMAAEDAAEAIAARAWAGKDASLWDDWVAAVDAAKADYERLLWLNLEDKEVSQGIEPDESGPMGRLWPNGEPAWYK